MKKDHFRLAQLMAKGKWDAARARYASKYTYVILYKLGINMIIHRRITIRAHISLIIRQPFPFVIHAMARIRIEEGNRMKLFIGTTDDDYALLTRIRHLRDP